MNILDVKKRNLLDFDDFIVVTKLSSRKKLSCALLSSDIVGSKGSFGDGHSLGTDFSVVIINGSITISSPNT